MNLRVRRKSYGTGRKIPWNTMEVGLFMCREKEIDERRELERTQYGAMQEDALAS